MHELSIALGIVDTVTEQARAQGYRSVTAVHVRVGALAGIARDALEFSWELATDGTALAGAALVVQTVPLVVYCTSCKRTEQLESTLALPCGACGAASRDIQSGRELQIVAVEVPDEDASDRDQPVDPQQERQAGRRAAATVRP